MSRLTHILRGRTADMLFRSGLLAGVIRARSRRSATVLMYHRVTSEHPAEKNGASGISVSSKTFEKHLRFLKNHFRVISQSEYLRYLEQRVDFPPGSVLITFDDGWRDNYDHAYPALKKEGLPAVVLPASGFIGSSELFWQDRLRRCLGELRNRDGATDEQRMRLFRICNSPEFRQAVLADNSGLPAAVNSCIQVFKKKPVEEAEKIIAGLEKLTDQGGARFKRRRFLSWPELTEMSENGIDIGSHGMTHAILTAIGDPGRIAREIAGSRQILEFGLSRKVRLFSYPNGDFNRDISEAVRRSGYAAAFGTARGVNACTDDPYQMKRMNIHEDMAGTEPMFLARAAGLW